LRLCRELLFVVVVARASSLVCLNTDSPIGLNHDIHNGCLHGLGGAQLGEGSRTGLAIWGGEVGVRGFCYGGLGLGVCFFFFFKGVLCQQLGPLEGFWEKSCDHFRKRGFAHCLTLRGGLREVSPQLVSIRFPPMAL